MTMPEIIFGAILLVASLVIIVLTVSQRSKGQGLSSAIMGANSPMAGSNVRQEDIMMAKLTKIAAVILVIVAVVAVFVLGSIVVIFVLMLKGGKKKNKYASRPISAPAMPPVPQNGPIGGAPVSQIPDGVTMPMGAGSNEATIPMGPARGSKTPSLVFSGSDSEGKALKFRVSLTELQRERSIMIGRSSATCKIHVANKAVSRQQARLIYEEDAEGNVYLFIKDEQARNTTCLNGVPLRDKCLLMPGDEISFADITLKFSTEMA